MLYEVENYLNKNIPFIRSEEIREYDLSSAGFNISKYFKLLDSDKIKYLESLNKKERQIQIGLYQKNDSGYKEKLKEGFLKARELFFKSNNIKDDEVLSIKKDAIFIRNKICKNYKFDNMEFKEKNLYTSYYRINRCEFYIGNFIDVKGISDSKLIPHKDYMLDFLYRLFKALETTKDVIVIKNLVDFISYYKNRQLDINYYRELNDRSLFRWKKYDKTRDIFFTEPSDGIINNIDIGYNYIRYLVPLINILI